MDRAQTYGLLLSHLDALHMPIERYIASYCLQVTLPASKQGEPPERYRALVLACSSDYWQQRVHLRPKGRPGLVICFTHDTCLPCAVLALDEGYQYEPRELPHWYSPDKRGTTRGSMVLLGQLLSGDEAGFQQIHDPAFPRSTRYRYLAQMRHFLQNRVGRPLIT